MAGAGWDGTANQPNPWGEQPQTSLPLILETGAARNCCSGIFFRIRRKAGFGAECSLSSRVRKKPCRVETLYCLDAIQKVTVRNDTNLSNNWIGLDMVLVNKVTGLAWLASREVSYYYGSSGGELVGR